MQIEKNLALMWKDRVQRFGEKTYMRFKRDGQWIPLTYNQVNNIVDEIALGLLALGVKRGDRISLLSENRPEWAFTDLAAQCLGAILVTIYATNTPAQCEYIINNSESDFVMLSNNNQLTKLTNKSIDITRVKSIVIFDPIEGITDKDPRVKTFEEIKEMGRRYEKKEVLQGMIEASTHDDVATLIYTSGTTGNPKGVMLTHGNFLSNCASVLSVVPITPHEDFLSFLPLSHSLERTAGHFGPLYLGATVTYAESVDALGNNLQEIKPTIMISVPRIYEKVHGRIMDNVKGYPPLKQKLFHWAIGVAKEHLKYELDKKAPPFTLKLQYDLADKLVFGKIKANLGGKMRFAISGGAPLAPELFEFFFSIGVHIYEGYGLTETTPIITANTPDAVRMGSVGKVIPGVTVKIADDGEILVKGPNVMKGYWKREEDTAEALEGGWFHTGDIGVIDGEGYLKITDRKKDLIVTAGGKNVAPQNIENLMKLQPYIEQVNVIGDKRKFLTAIIVPTFPALEKWAKEKGISYNDRADLVKKTEIKELITKDVEKVNGELAKFESIKKFHLSAVEFTQENDMMTPTMKVRRKIVNKHFAKEIEGMYES